MMSASMQPRIRVGETLRRQRESLGLSLEQVHAQIRIPIRSLQALEEERFDVFPAPQYARGFCRSYASFLGLDPEPLVAQLPYPAEASVRSLVARGEVPIRPARRIPRWHRFLRWAVFTLIAGLVSVGYVAYRELRAFMESRPQAVPAALRSPAPSPEASPTLEPALPSAFLPASGVRLVLVADDLSWIRVVADGRRIFEGFIRGGERREWSGRERISIVLGNAGAVRVEVNGVELGRLGGPGEVVRRTFTGRNGAR
jgi:cytoskeleton protein RodZ